MTHSPAASAVADPRLEGWRLAAARTAWVIVGLVAVGLFVASVPYYYEQFAASSDPQAQSSEAVKAGLEQLGVPVVAYNVFRLAVLTLLAGVFVGVGALVFWRKSDDPAALYFSLVLVVFGAIWPNTLDALPEEPVLDFLSTGVGTFGFVAFFLLLYVFPDGRFVPRWTRWVALAFVADLLFVTLFPGAHGEVLRWFPWFELVEIIVFIGTMIFAQIYRYLRVSTQLQRQQTKWVMSAMVVAMVCFIGTGLLEELPVFGASGIPAALFDFATLATYGLSFMLVPVAIGMAVLRRRLWDIDPIVNRVLVYGALTACVVGLYVFVVGYLGGLFRVDGNLFVSLVATGIVAVAFQPMRDRLQRAVNRLMYGERDDPYKVLSRLGERLEATLAPEAALSTVVETVARSLKLPYAAISLPKHGGVSATAAEYGTPTGETIALPLTHRREPMGELVLSPRSPGEAFSSTDLKLLEDLARQAGAAVHAVRLTADLQRSRERLVTAREEERRRLRRDLHDGLGSQLAAQTLKIGSARLLCPRDPAAADALMAELESDVENAISDIRRVVYDLRPPDLDEMGLAGAVRESAAAVSRTKGPRVAVEAPEELPDLPAAVEVAAYRIVREALTNVVKHSGAKSCRIRLSLDDELELEIADDGSGVPEKHKAGVGLASMKERAAELGGTCIVESVPGGGTRVSARLPLPREDGHER